MVDDVVVVCSGVVERRGGCYRSYRNEFLRELQMDSGVNMKID